MGLSIFHTVFTSQIFRDCIWDGGNLFESLKARNQPVTNALDLSLARGSESSGLMAVHFGERF